MLDLELCRFDFDLITSTAGSNDPIGTFGFVSVWLRTVCMSKVSHFDFSNLADFCRYKFDSSTSTSPSDESVRTFFPFGGWS